MLRLAVPFTCLLLFPPIASADPHWSFRPRGVPAVPAMADPAARAWVRTSVDPFVLTALRAQGLKPAPDADRGTLIRRLSFDLTGLPPTPKEIRLYSGNWQPPMPRLRKRRVRP